MVSSAGEAETLGSRPPRRYLNTLPHERRPRAGPPPQVRRSEGATRCCSRPTALHSQGRGGAEQPGRCSGRGANRRSAHEEEGVPRVEAGERMRGVKDTGIQKQRKGPSSHPCRTPARKASHSGCSPPSPPAHPSAPSPRSATKRRMGRKAGRRRRRPKGPYSGTGPPSSRPMKGAGQETGAGPPPAPTPTPGWKRDESFPRPPRRAARWPRRASPPHGASTRPPPTAPNWWRRMRGPGASAPSPAAGAQAEQVRDRPGTAEWPAPGRQPSAGPCQEPLGPRGERPGQSGGRKSVGRALQEAILHQPGSRALETANRAAPRDVRGSPHVIFRSVRATTTGRALWWAGPGAEAESASAPPPRRLAA